MTQKTKNKFKSGDLIIGEGYLSQIQEDIIIKRNSFWIGHVLDVPNKINNRYKIFWMYLKNNCELTKLEYESHRKDYTENTFTLCSEKIKFIEESKHAE